MKSALIIDDHEEIAACIKASVPIDRCKCVGRMTEGLTELQSAQYDAVFVDLNLPDSSAERTWQMIPVLRRLANGAMLIVVTGHAEVIDDRNERFVDAVIRKPFHSGHIRDAVQTARMARERETMLCATAEDTRRTCRVLLTLAQL